MLLRDRMIESIYLSIFIGKIYPLNYFRKKKKNTKKYKTQSNVGINWYIFGKKIE